MHAHAHHGVEAGDDRPGLGRGGGQPPVPRVQAGVQWQPGGVEPAQPLLQPGPDGVVPAAGTVLVLPAGEVDAQDGHELGHGPRGEVPAGTGTGAVARDHAVEPGGHRVLGVQHADPDRDPAAVRELLVQLGDRPSRRGPAHEQQVGVAHGLDVVQPQPAGRAHDRAPGDVVRDARRAEGVGDGVHGEDVTSRRLAVQDAGPTDHECAHGVDATGRTGAGSHPAGGLWALSPTVTSRHSNW